MGRDLQEGIRKTGKRQAGEHTVTPSQFALLHSQGGWSRSGWGSWETAQHPIPPQCLHLSPDPAVSVQAPPSRGPRLNQKPWRERVMGSRSRDRGCSPQVLAQRLLCSMNIPAPTTKEQREQANAPSAGRGRKSQRDKRERRAKGLAQGSQHGSGPMGSRPVTSGGRGLSQPHTGSLLFRALGTTMDLFSPLLLLCGRRGGSRRGAAPSKEQREERKALS